MAIFNSYVKLPEGNLSWQNGVSMSDVPPRLIIRVHGGDMFYIDQETLNPQ